MDSAALANQTPHPPRIFIVQKNAADPEGPPHIVLLWKGAGQPCMSSSSLPLVSFTAHITKKIEMMANTV